jgi:protein phosphatase
MSTDASQSAAIEQPVEPSASVVEDAKPQPAAEVVEQSPIPEKAPAVPPTPYSPADEAMMTPGVTRPLPQEPILPPQRGHIIYGQSSDQGMVRSNNQDAAISYLFTSDTVDELTDFGIFIVADGMGGHQEGEKASALAARVVANEMLSRIFLPIIRGTNINDADQPTIVEALQDAVRLANQRIRDELEGSGTTLTAVVVRGDSAHIAHVGDSRAYWITRKGMMEKLTRDHSVVERLKELGQLTDEEVEVHEQRNVLYRALGQGHDDVEPDIFRQRLHANSSLLICSDGLWNMVKSEEMSEIVINTADPQEACEKLIARANTHGGTDNITAILIKTPSS